MRTRTRAAIVSVLEDQSVCLEFLGASQSATLVTEVLGVSPDGLRILVYSPNGGHGVRPIGDGAEAAVGPSGDAQTTGTPVPAENGDTCAMYTLNELPERYWKKYNFITK